MKTINALIIAASIAASAPAQAGFISLNTTMRGLVTVTQLADGSFQVTGGFGGIVTGYQPGGLGALENASASFDTNFIGSGTGNFSFAGNIFAPDESGTLIATDTMSAAINWTSATANTLGAVLSGNGTVLTSSGDLGFENDFPVGGNFDITAIYFTTCGRFPITCGDNPPIGGTVGLFNGALNPVTVPAPSIGYGWMAGLLTLAAFARFRSAQS